MAVVNRRGQQFAAEVGEWTLSMKDRTKRVWQDSVVEFCEVMNRPVSRGGNMPVLTGFLRSSLMCSTSPQPFGTMERPSDDQRYLYFPNRVEAAVRAAKVGQTLYIGYMAEYVDPVEYGWSGHPGYGFQRLAIQQWDTIQTRVFNRIMGAS